MRRSLSAGLVVVGFFVVQRLLWPAPLGIVVRGAIVGGLTALIALGIALVYRSNRIVNFAQGDLGAFPGVLAVLLIVSSGLPWGVAALAGLATSLVLGAVVDAVVIRRFFRAPRLILTVATIGLAQVLAAGGVLLLKVFDLRRPPQSYPSPLDLDFTIDPVVFSGNDVVAVIAIPVVLVVLGLFLQRTGLGMAVRASAENADRASLLGIPVKRVQTAVWMLASALAFVAVFLRAGVVGLPIGTVLGPGILLRALAAAVIGRMERLPTIAVAAVCLGVLEQAVVWDTGRAAYVDPILFVVVLGALLIAGRHKITRRQTDDASTWRAAREVRPVPRALASRPEVRAARWAGGALLAVVLVLLPVVLSESRTNLASVIVIYGVIALSLVVLTGWAGQVSLGQMALVGIGAAVGGALTSRLGWDLALVVVSSGLAGAAAAALIGVPALRVRGLELAVTTLALALAVSTWLLNPEFSHWLPEGRVERQPLFGVVGIGTEDRFYWLALVGLALALLALRGVRRSRTGRVLIAARENPRAAQSFGVNTTRTTLMAFAMSGFLAGYAGALFIHHQEALGVSAYRPEQSLAVFTMVVIGGLGSVPGALIGATYVRGIEYFLPEEYRILATGAGLLAVLLLVPGGLGSLLERARDRLVRMLARGRSDDDERAPEPVLGRADEDGPPVATSRTADSDGGRHDEGALVVRDLDVAYDGAQVLFDVDLAVAEGEVLALVGTNGAGKSTLLRAVSGLAPVTAGTISLDGDDITSAPPHRIAALGVGHAPGGQGVFAGLTVAENLRMAGWLQRRRSGASTEATERVLGYFPALRERLAEPAGNLSGGQQQMLTLAMVFVSHPRLLMIDELSLGLSPAIVEQLLTLVRDMRDEGTAVVVVDQSLQVALDVADRACFMEKGTVRFEGPANDLAERDDLVRSVFLQGAGQAVATLGTAHEPRTGGVEAPPLAVEGMTLHFGGITALDDVGFELGRGEVKAVIGPNGAGKTTLFDVISGFTPAESGVVRLAGRDVTTLGPAARACAGLGRSFQDARLFPALTVDETVAVALERHVAVRDPLAAALNLPAVRQAERAVSARVDELLETLNLTGYRNAFVRELSTGTRRVLDMACVLAHQPTVLLLDEPSAGLAQREVEALAPLIGRIREATGASVLVVEHEMTLVRAVADSVVALDAGAVIASGSADRVLDDPRVVAAYLGTRLVRDSS